MQVRKLNWRPSLQNKFGLKFHHLPEFSLTTKVPKMVDLEHFMPPIKDQGEHGFCSGFSSSYDVEFLELQELRAQKPLNQSPQEFAKTFQAVSPTFICNNARIKEDTLATDAGVSNLMDCVNVITEVGVCREITFPYIDSNLFRKPTATAYKEAAAHKVPIGYEMECDERHLMLCLANGFPFICGIVVYDGFMETETGVVPWPRAHQKPLGGHAVCICGYKYGHWWKIQNSWGTEAGDRGYYYVPWEYLTDPEMADDHCTLRY